MVQQQPSLPFDIAGLTADSRQVRPGWLFAALPGVKADGRAFIAAAAAQGAVAVLAVPGTEVPDGVTLIADANPRLRFAQLAAAFYRRQPAAVAAVTGTNGKTSVASFARQIWQRLGLASASLGTLGVVAPDYVVPGGLTTPDPVTLHRVLAELQAKGVEHAAIEASSHGLDQFRLDAIALCAAGFTNLTRDHLDYHADMDAYGAAKLRLFSEVLPAGGTAVVNADAPFAETILAVGRARGHRLFTYGFQGEQIRLNSVTPDATGQSLDLSVLGRGYAIHLPLAGSFQAANALCALGLVLGSGAVDQDEAVAALASLEGVPGRLQKVAEKVNGAPVYVDYAHTPDALETVLRALRPHAERRLVVAFGCGGDRDPGKRPQMGRIAAELADLAIVTDDNPRSEQPAAIRAAILAACPGAVEIGDRAQAIRQAVAGLEPGDLLVVAGKGHETGQTVAGVIHPFDDAEEARKAVMEAGE